jgi:hypothetical protein
VSYPREAGTIPAGKCACGHWARADEVTECRYCDCTQHRVSPYGGHNPQDPPGAEAALQSFSDALEPAREELAAAVDEEVRAELARDSAKRYWLLHGTCPKTGVFDGVRVTVAERDAWVEEKIADKEYEFRMAEVKRKAAAKKLAILERQSSVQQSISKSVGEAYRGTGSERW